MIRADIVRKTAISLGTIHHKLAEAIDTVLMTVAGEIVADVAGAGPHAAPYREGHLRDSYYAERVDTFEVRVANNMEIAPYAIFVEMGTCKMAARPHLKPAAEAARDKLNELLREINL